ncbi:MarR family transcriptional regulator [Haloquadratum walsbyi]|jgi:DNA-binding MarR family transcriptional regulator|uniref:NP_1176A family transcription regulator n=2 Tax=Haloquadratum walsbyi TaxID=293091 RepID=Q18KF3_HALWD|nr:helix-turn-helix domain-containing protein [Haloquadratum walsbyi]CAJ51498.1 NP_1176A family transcription regulator [Haloquadratum walsbyi DSM 16790]CCC39383.1 NP_1176A family transcription regulator [Haloquadratum walsbyi C23]
MAKGEEERLDDLPPSAKLVFKVLEYSGPLTQKGIVEESMLSARTVRYALERLEDIDIVDEDVYFADARQNLYQLTEAVPKAATSTDGGESGSTSSLSDSESDSEPDSEVEPRHAE